MGLFKWHKTEDYLMILAQINLKRIAKKQGKYLVTALLAAIFYAPLGHAQVIGADLAAEVSNLGANTKAKRNSALFSSAKTTFSLSDELQFKPGAAIDQDNYTAKAEFWSKGVWGISGNVQQNDLKLFGLPKGSDSKRIDINRKVIKADSSDSYLAFGFGFQSVDIQNTIESEGLNLSLLGKYSFTDNFLFYGNGTLFQGFDDSYQGDVSGYQFEAGLNYSLGSRLSFSAGLKVSDLEGQQNFQESRSFSSSFLIGTSLAF